MFPFSTQWGIVLRNSRHPSVPEHVFPVLNFLRVSTIYQIPEELTHRLQVSFGRIAPCSLLYGGQVYRVVISVWALLKVHHLFVPILDQVSHLMTVLAVLAFTLQSQGEPVEGLQLCSHILDL